MEFLFASVNEGLNRYLVNLKQVYATGEGGYKNVLYPDLEIAHDVCIEKIERFLDSQEKVSWAEEAGGEIQRTVGNDVGGRRKKLLKGMMISGFGCAVLGFCHGKQPGIEGEHRGFT